MRQTAVLLTILLSLSLGIHGVAYGVTIFVEVGAEIIEFLVKNETSIAATGAVAHTLAGTGAATAGSCFRISIIGAGVSCGNSDSFFHPSPLGSDNAIASAFGQSWNLGFSGEALAPEPGVTKGDFAAGAAYARGGASLSAIGGSLAETGATHANATITLGGVSISGSKDPSDSLYGFMLTDQHPGVLNKDLLSEVVQGISPKKLFGTALDGTATNSPPHIFFALLLNVDGETGDLNVRNFGLLVPDPLDVSDFERSATAGDTTWTLRGTREFSIDIPFLDLTAAEQNITIEEMSLKVAVVPEPSTLLLLGSSLAGLGGFAWRRQRRK